MKCGLPFIVNLACNGIRPSHASTRQLPVTQAAVVEEVGRALEAGVQMLHLHAHDRHGEHTSDPEPYGRLIESIRALPGGQEAVLIVSTSGRREASLAKRCRVLELDGAMRPDMASLTLSSLNFLQSASLNPPEVIRALAARMRERGIRPELEVFDPGMANFARVLLKEGLLQPPLYVNVLLGNVAGSQANLLQLAAILAALPEGCIVCVAGLGRFQLTANLLGLTATDGVRVGLEDNLWLDPKRTVAATNLLLVERVLRLASELARPLLPRAQVRRLLLEPPPNL